VPGVWSGAGAREDGPDHVPRNTRRTVHTMSRAALCGGCLMGDHKRHERDRNIHPGVIGGEYCDCPGDCAEVFWARVLGKPTEQGQAT
jgi:hypothetical protein